MSSIDNLIAHFKSQGIQFEEPSSDADLKRFESKYEVRLPNDFRTYLSIGHPAGWDNELMEFYGLSKLEIQSSAMSSDIYCVFADYSINCWHYLLRLPRAENEESPVFVGHNDFHLYYRNKIADSFSDFIERYLKEGLIVYNPSPSVLIREQRVLGPSDKWIAIRNDGLRPELGIQYFLEFQHSSSEPFNQMMGNMLESPLLTWIPWMGNPDLTAIPQISLQVLNRLVELERDFPYERERTPVLVGSAPFQLAGYAGWKFMAHWLSSKPVASDFDEKKYGFRAEKYRTYICLPYQKGVLILMDELTVGKETAIHAPLSDPMRIVLESLDIDEAVC